MVILFGAFALHSNGTSYNNSVSTIVRTAQSPEVGLLMHFSQRLTLRLHAHCSDLCHLQIQALVQGSTSGAMPFPPHIAEAKLSFGILQDQYDTERGSVNTQTDDILDLEAVEI
ncbi:uncharacterized protein PAC_19156 [Phialocephala subalpina]|uniref:Uncharacterized protein n=1 Tax=Phialocephala subalpina TaxID=576137 RepID=A0A1L7XW62_9HELO|nr:uncharacterized protein PAC_19156 [Phialocephala subalpina]